MEFEEYNIERRDDDEIINKPILENRYDITASLCGMILTQTSGNSISYSEIRDFENSTFPVRKLRVSLKDKEIVEFMNYKRDDDGLLDCTLLVSFSDESNVMKNKPFPDGKFKALPVDGDINISMRDTMDDLSITKVSDRPSIREVTLILFREDEIGTLDDDNINFLIENCDLRGLLVFLFNKFTKYDFILSDPDHNPNIKRFLVPQMSLHDVLKLIDTDMGIYRSGYNLFINEGVLYFINKDNDLNCRNRKLEFSINLLVSKPGDDLKSAMVDKLNNGNFTIIIGQNECSVTRKLSNSINETINYVNPNGTKVKNRNLLSRNIRTVHKITSIPPLTKHKNKIREELTVNINNIGVDKLNPLSTIFYTDSQNKRREYRVSSAKLFCASRSTISLSIKAFRLLDRGGESNAND